MLLRVKGRSGGAAFQVMVLLQMASPMVQASSSFVVATVAFHLMLKFRALATFQEAATHRATKPVAAERLLMDWRAKGRSSVHYTI
jgi:hypothetical protein